MRTLFDGIPLEEMTVSMTMNGAVLPVLALYIVAAEEQGVPPEKLAGTIQNDILKEFMVRNTYIYPPEPSMRIVSDIFAYTARTCRSSIRSRFPAITCRKPARRSTLSLPIRSPTASNMCARGLPPGSRSTAFAPRLSFFFGIGMNYFHGDRQAARRAHAVGEADAPFEPKSDEARLIPAHALPDLGLVAHRAGSVQQCGRTCIEAMAATQGGTQSLHTNALDEALALPSDFSARIARNTQLFLQQESRHLPHHRPVGRQLFRRAADL
jgi:methylmalonyl-CoA mutase